MSHIQDKYPLVIGVNNPLLREKSKQITFPLSQDLKDLYKALPVLMEKYDGVGLAAIQVGIPVQMAVTTQWSVIWEEYDYLWETVMINPRILKESTTTIVTEEWCLSLPWMTGMVERPETITVEYFDVSWKKYTDTYRGFNAVVVQHEIDHLNWVLFVDKIVH